MSSMQIVTLGTGTPNDEPDRVSSGVAIVVNNQPYLVDIGHGIVQRVVQAHHSNKISWNTTHLTRLFVTHLHADHTVGLPDLIFTPWIHNRTKTIQAYGPIELKHMIDHILLAYRENIREHREAHPSTENGYKIDAYAVADGECYKDENVTVYALPANHGDLIAYSYKFVAGEKSVVISGDTKPVPEFAEWAKGCDMLIHEVYSSKMFPTKPPEWQAYHSRVHTSTDELAQLVNQIQPKQLILYHQLFWGQTSEELVAEIAQYYDGLIVSANDLDIFAVE